MNKLFKTLFFVLIIAGITSCKTSTEIKNEKFDLEIDLFLAYGINYSTDGSTAYITYEGDDAVSIWKNNTAWTLEEIKESEINSYTTLVSEETFDNGYGEVFEDDSDGEYFEYVIEIDGDLYECSALYYGLPVSGLIDCLKSMRKASE